MPRIYTRRPVFDRVMDKIIKQDDGHWIWTGSKGSSGYGKTMDGRTNLLVHRVVWEHLRGPIPPGWVLDHLDHCLTILCCNPDHLEPVTQPENLRRQSARRTSCKAGHPYTDGTPKGRNGRECRACHARREAERRERQRLAKSPNLTAK